MNSKIYPIIFAIITPLLLSLPLAGQISPAAGSTSPAKESNRPIPFHGMVGAVDQKNKTFTITGKDATRVFKVTEKTNILKGAGNAKFSDIVENQEVSGAYWKNADGSLEAKLIKLGPTEKKNLSATPKSSATAAEKP
jgi:hypothetical protein